MSHLWTASYRRFFLLYLVFWLAIGFAYEALFMLTPSVDVYAAFITGLNIVGTAAILGVGGIVVAAMAPLPQDRLFVSLTVHAFGAFIYSLVWVGVLMAIRNVEVYLSADDFQFVIPPGFVVRWHLLAGTAMYATIVSGVIAFRSVARVEAERQAADMRALRAQLNPHFLFNSLHTISMLFRSEPTKAEAAMETFSDLIRYALYGDKMTTKSKDGQTLVTVADEWGIIEKYLALEKLRLEDRLRFDVTIAPPANNCLIPPLTIQPLVENAVQHGAAVAEGGADINISVNRQGTQLFIRVENNGVQQNKHDFEGKAVGIGLKALNARIKKAFGAKATLTTGVIEGFNFVAEITVPALDLER